MKILLSLVACLVLASAAHAQESWVNYLQTSIEQAEGPSLCGPAQITFVDQDVFDQYPDSPSIVGDAYSDTCLIRLSWQYWNSATNADRCMMLAHEEGHLRGWQHGSRVEMGNADGLIDMSLWQTSPICAQVIKVFPWGRNVRNVPLLHDYFVSRYARMVADCHGHKKQRKCFARVIDPVVNMILP